MNDHRYYCEYWSGDSRDGVVINGDGYHYYRMSKEGEILEALEAYENEEGEEVATPLPEMKGVSWITDLGFEDFEALDVIKDSEFERVRKLIDNNSIE